VDFGKLVLERGMELMQHGLLIGIGEARVEVTVQSKLGDDTLVILLNDISEIRKREQLQAKEEMQSIFFASVAHDLKTPINSIYGAN